MSRKTAFVGFSYMAGLLLASFFSAPLSIAIGAVLLGFGLYTVFIFRPKHSGNFYRSAVCAVACCVGLWIYSGYDLTVCRNITANNNGNFCGTVTIEQSTVYSEEKAFYIAHCTFPNGASGNVGFFDRRSDLVKGDKVTLSGQLYAPENTGFFNSADYYRSMNVFLLMKSVRISGYEIKEHNFYRTLDDFRHNVSDTIRKYVPSEEGELLIGMLFGSSKWNMSDRTENLLYRAGIGHVAAVSGLHMSVAAGIAAALAIALRLPKWGQFISVTAVSLLFAMTAGFTPSVVRSLIMVMFVWAAGIFNRRSDSLTSLAAAIIIMTISSPFIVRSTSFLLSVSGTIGTAVLSPMFINAYEKKMECKTDLPYHVGALVSALCSSLCAAAAVFPVSALTFDQISIASPMTNLLLSPLCTAAIAIAAIGALLCIFPLTFISGGLFLAAGLICRPILAVAKFIGSSDIIMIPTGTELTAPLVAIAVISAALCLILTHDKMYFVLTCLSAALVSVVCIEIYRLIPTGYTEISVLTDGSGCVIVVKNDSCSQIYDYMGTRSGAKAAYRSIAGSGGSAAAFAAVTKQCAYSESVYKGLFKGIAVLSPVTKSGLTYSAEDNIIKFGNTVYYPHENYSIIETDGVKILCVTGKTELPDEKFDLCIYSCSADVYADADYYTVADSDFKGKIYPFGSTGTEYIADNGVLYPKEGVSWLR